MARVRVWLTPADFVQAASDFVNAHGLEALTMRALGERLGVDPTALYRHFPSKDALITAMLDDMMGGILIAWAPDDQPPRERLRQLLLAARNTFRMNPNLTSAFAMSSGQIPNALDLMRRALDALEEMGLSGDDLVAAMQMLEGYVIGASVFDLARAPEHYEVRRQRYRVVEHEAYDRISRTTADVERVTEAAFERGLDGLLDVCERLAAAAVSVRR